MEKFLNQFKLAPMMRVKFENFIFRAADALVVGYSGGFWNDDHVGKSCILAIPTNEPTITLRNERAGTEVTTDPLTASAAFTALVVNWFWNANSANIGDEANDEFSTFWHALCDDVYDDKSGNGINKDDYFTFTD